MKNVLHFTCFFLTKRGLETSVGWHSRCQLVYDFKTPVNTDSRVVCTSLTCTQDIKKQRRRILTNNKTKATCNQYSTCKLSSGCCACDFPTGLYQSVCYKTLFQETARQHSLNWPRLLWSKQKRWLRLADAALVAHWDVEMKNQTEQKIKSVFKNWT